MGVWLLLLGGQGGCHGFWVAEVASGCWIRDVVCGQCGGRAYLLSLLRLLTLLWKVEEWKSCHTL